MATKRDYYEVLGVNRDCSTAEIKSAYRKLAFQYHPDRNREDGAEAKFKEVNEAYETLCNPEKRESYDRFGHNGGDSMFGQGFDGFGFDGVGSIFDAFFGGRTSSSTRRAPVRGADLYQRVTVTLQEAAFGVEKEVKISRTENCSECHGNGSKPGTQPTRCPECNGSGQVRRVQQSIFGRFTNIGPCPHCQGEGTIITEPCPKCRGNGKEKNKRNILVKIPSGIENASRIRLTGEGDAGSRGGPAGNLYVDVEVSEDKTFIRENDDILYELKINFAQAALGTEVSIPTLHGDEKLKIPSGSQNGQVFTLKNKGVPHLHGRGFGHQRVMLNVVTPEKLSRKQKKLFEELARELE